MNASSTYTPYRVRFLLIVIGMSGILLSRLTNSWNVYGIIFIIVELVCLELILRESTLFLTIYFRLISVCVSVYLVGALFKILHWEGGDLLLLFSLSGVAVIYLIRTINKRKLIVLDFVKCAWVIAACANTIIRLLHWPYSVISGYATVALFIAMFILFFLSPNQPRQEDIPYEEKPLDQIN